MAGLTFATTLTTPLGLLTGPIVARALGPGGRGEVSTATVYSTLMWLVVSLGLPIAIGQRSRGDGTQAGSLLGTSVRFSLVVMPLVGALAYLLSVGPLGDFSGAAKAGIFVLMAVAPLNIVMNSQQAILMAEGSLRPITNLRAIPIAFSALGVVAFALAGVLTVGSYLGITVTAGLITMAMTWRYLPLRPQGTQPIRPILSFGLRSVGGQLAGVGNRVMDQAILAVTVGARQVGLYSVAVVVAGIPAGFGQAISARAYSEVLQRADGEWQPQAARYLRLSIIVGVASSTVIGLTCPFVLPLAFGRAFNGSVAPMLLLLPGTAVLPPGVTAGRILVALNRPGKATLAEIIALGVTLGGLAIAVPLYGIRGAAVVSTAAYLTRLVVLTRVLRSAGLTQSLRPGWSDVVEARGLLEETIKRVLRRARRGAPRGRRPSP